ncbi:mannosyl-oligosaccharide alpha-1,2-mannosidase [Saxophila tyrrhenica]|uniref:alpha-1,2-Mannosidase n=1 Tax=Saxophila tyrrhenica TaxID=1690608 RepID=A0AAV9NW79_9PEZI|nr:mannosyl-oligosaccharide alpha-1,2-mannosidase [Saxophila tyrrhenica]
MNNRDPFNLRRIPGPALSILQSRASNLGEHLARGANKAAEVGRNVLQEVSNEAAASMSSYAPNFQNGPTQRHPEQWQSAQSKYAPSTSSSGNGISETVSGLFGGEKKDGLPMYKDKPFSYPGSRRKVAWWKQKRTVAAVLTTFAVISWWFGILSPLSYFTRDEAPATQKTESKTSWFGGGGGAALDWNSRAQKVKEAFKLSFDGYNKYAWGHDEFHPVSKGKRQMVPNGMGWIIVDALDTMMIMNLTDEVAQARQWIHHNLTYDQDHDVNTFETTIRMLGGLLSAHYLSNRVEETYAMVDDDLGDDLYIEKATDLADRLLGAYETTSGVPLASVNLHTQLGIPSHADGGASSTAEATTLQLEMKYLANLTGENNYWEHAEHVMQVVDDNNAKDGLVPIFIYADSGNFRGENIRLGSRGDSYYEYLIKQFLQTSQQEPVYQAMWNETLAGVKKNLITYSAPSNFTVLAERPNGLGGKLSPKMDHLVCFMPGTIALAATGGLPLNQAKAQPNWGPRQDEDMRLAEELMNTCWGMYKTSPIGLAGEITHFNLHDPPLMYEEFTADNRPTPPAAFDTSGLGDEFVGHEDFMIKGADAHNLQRPETIESLFYMWRITGDEKYRNWGWEMFESFVKWTAVEDGTGYTSLTSVLTTPPPQKDNMESFWLAETLKYFYLLFSPTDILPLTDVVFNTEAHAFPRFQLGKLFKTGWERKPRDTNGKLLESPNPKVETRADDAAAKQTPTLEKIVVPDPAGQTPEPKAGKAEEPAAAAAPEAEKPLQAEAGRDPVTGKEAAEGPQVVQA